MPHPHAAQPYEVACETFFCLFPWCMGDWLFECLFGRLWQRVGAERFE